MNYSRGGRARKEAIVAGILPQTGHGSLAAVAGRVRRMRCRDIL